MQELYVSKAKFKRIDQLIIYNGLGLPNRERSVTPGQQAD